MTNKTVLGVIPARGGSKGVPRKNIRPLCGRPLISYTIEAGRNAKTLDRLIVSTDDSEIAETAKQEGAEVPFLRPAKYSGDEASGTSVLRHAMRWFREHEKYEPDAVVYLPPTTPFRTAEQIDGTVGLLWASGLDSAVVVYPVQDHPYFIYRLDKKKRLAELMPMRDKPQLRQDLPEFYAHCISVIVSRRSYLDLCGNSHPILNPASVAGFEISRETAWDIDTTADFEIAEYMMRKATGGG